MSAVARVANVSHVFEGAAGPLEVVSGVSFDVRAGELALLMGPSGSGKTTLVSILAGLRRPTRGAVEIHGTALDALDEDARAAIRRAHVGFVFQTHNLFPALSALDNVALGHRLRGLGRGEGRRAARITLERLGLGHRLEHRPGELSIGEQQRVAIARAMTGDPSLLIGDEPTAALDGEGARTVMELVRKTMAASPAIGVVIVTHDRRLEPYADRILSLEDGRLVDDRTSHAMRS